MTTTAIQPASPTTMQTKYAVLVRRARTFLRYLFWIIIVAGVLTSGVSFWAAYDTLNRYQSIAQDSAASADAAQSARSDLLAYHSAAADYLSLQENKNEANQALRRTIIEWESYQQEIRRVWENRSDRQFGEYPVFEAADASVWRYKAHVDVMIALVEQGSRDEAELSFLAAHETLIQEVLPALNGLESVKLESMEDAYEVASDMITTWQQVLLVVGGIALSLLLLAFLLTRFWLHYAFTAELGIATLLTIVLFGWFNFTLIDAANQVEVLVRNAYDTVSGTQSVEALLTQAEAVESMAIFVPTEADGFLRDADEYLFLLEQRLCGERACTDTSFKNGSSIDFRVAQSALDGQSKYGLPRVPLVANAYDNNFAGEAEELESLRLAIAQYRDANELLSLELAGNEGTASVEQRELSTEAYNNAIQATHNEQRIVQTKFNDIYDSVTFNMEINWWLAAGFSLLAVLGAWGVRRRRKALFA